MNGSACDNFIQDSLALGSAREGGASLTSTSTRPQETPLSTSCSGATACSAVARRGASDGHPKTAALAATAPRAISEPINVNSRRPTEEGG